MKKTLKQWVVILAHNHWARMEINDNYKHFNGINNGCKTFAIEANKTNKALGWT